MAAYAKEGSSFKLPGTKTFLNIKDIDIKLDYYGYISDWSVKVEYKNAGDIIQQNVITPNNPSLFSGLNVNIKNLRSYPEKIVLLQLNREPGALLALVGSVLFIIGIATLIVLKIRLES